MLNLKTSRAAVRELTRSASDDRDVEETRFNRTRAQSMREDFDVSV